jgi:hypothetical protein
VFVNICGDRYDYKRTFLKKRLPKLVNFLDDRRPMVIGLAECQEATALKIVAALAKRGLTYHSRSYYGSTILYAKGYVLTRVLLRRRWLSGTQTHSMLGAELYPWGSPSATFNVLVSHLPPFPWRAKLRGQQLATISKDVHDFHDPTILMMDANDKRASNILTAAGWVASLIGRIDVIATRLIAWTKFERKPGLRISDHDPLTLEAHL